MDSSHDAHPQAETLSIETAAERVWVNTPLRTNILSFMENAQLVQTLRLREEYFYDSAAELYYSLRPSDYFKILDTVEDPVGHLYPGMGFAPDADILGTTI